MGIALQPGAAPTKLSFLFHDQRRAHSLRKNLDAPQTTRCVETLPMGRNAARATKVALPRAIAARKKSNVAIMVYPQSAKEGADFPVFSHHTARSKKIFFAPTRHAAFGCEKKTVCDSKTFWRACRQPLIMPARQAILFAGMRKKSLARRRLACIFHLLSLPRWLPVNGFCAPHRRMRANDTFLKTHASRFCGKNRYCVRRLVACL